MGSQRVNNTSFSELEQMYSWLPSVLCLTFFLAVSKTSPLHDDSSLNFACWMLCKLALHGTFFFLLYLLTRVLNFSFDLP